MSGRYIGATSLTGSAHRLDVPAVPARPGGSAVLTGYIEAETAGAWAPPWAHGAPDPGQLPVIDPACVPPDPNDLGAPAGDLFERHQHTGCEWLARSCSRSEGGQDAAPLQRGCLRGVEGRDVRHCQLRSGRAGYQEGKPVRFYVGAQFVAPLLGWLNSGMASADHHPDRGVPGRGRRPDLQVAQARRAVQLLQHLPARHGQLARGAARVCSPPVLRRCRSSPGLQAPCREITDSGDSQRWPGDYVVGPGLDETSRHRGTARQARRPRSGCRAGLPERAPKDPSHLRHTPRSFTAGTLPGKPLCRKY